MSSHVCFLLAIYSTEHAFEHFRICIEWYCSFILNKQQ